MDEHRRRESLWKQLIQRDLGDLDPKLLRDLSVYGGAQGIWVDKVRTGGCTPSGAGVTVSILHTGKHYPDDLSNEGVIYHYPSTSRPPGRDAAEVQATKEARNLGVPLFVILPGDRSSSRRRVRLGWVQDWDDDSRQFLILFGSEQPAIPLSPDPDDPFHLEDEQLRRRLGQIQVRAGQQRFRFSVLKRYGCKCAVCSITYPRLIQAAHIRGKAFRGSDDWRNGLPLCPTHHAAFDAHLFAIEPGSLAIRFSGNITPDSLGITTKRLDVLRNVPHESALKWRFNVASSVVSNLTKDSTRYHQSTP